MVARDLHYAGERLQARGQGLQPEGVDVQPQDEVLQAVKKIPSWQAKVVLWKVLGGEVPSKSFLAKRLQVCRPTVIRGLRLAVGLPTRRNPRLLAYVPAMPPQAAKVALWMVFDGQAGHSLSANAEAMGMCPKTYRRGFVWLRDNGLLVEAPQGGIYFLPQGVNIVRPLAVNIDSGSVNFVPASSQNLHPVNILQPAPQGPSVAVQDGAERGEGGAAGMGGLGGVYPHGCKLYAAAVSKVSTWGRSLYSRKATFSVLDSVSPVNCVTVSYPVGEHYVLDGVFPQIVTSGAPILFFINPNTKRNLRGEKEIGIEIERGVGREREREREKEGDFAAPDGLSAVKPHENDALDELFAELEAERAYAAQGLAENPVQDASSEDTPEKRAISVFSGPDTHPATPTTLSATEADSRPPTAAQGGIEGFDLDNPWWLEAEGASLNPVEAIRLLQIWRYREITGKLPDEKTAERYRRDAFAILRWLKVRRKGYSWLLDFITWAGQNDFWSGRKASAKGKRYIAWPWLAQLLQSKAVEQFEAHNAVNPGAATLEAQRRKQERAQQRAKEFRVGQLFRLSDGRYARVDSISGQWLMMDIGSREEVGDPIGKGRRLKAMRPEEVAGLTPA